MRHAALGEETAERRIEAIEPARAGAEGGQDQPSRIAEEAAGGEPPGAGRDGRLRVIMPADLAGRAREPGRMAEGEGGEGERLDAAPAERARRPAVVVAG